MFLNTQASSCIVSPSILKTFVIYLQKVTNKNFFIHFLSTGVRVKSNPLVFFLNRDFSTLNLCIDFEVFQFFLYLHLQINFYLISLSTSSKIVYIVILHWPVDNSIYSRKFPLKIKNTKLILFQILEFSIKVAGIFKGIPT
jgi:hypothetical protein